MSFGVYMNRMTNCHGFGYLFLFYFSSWFTTILCDLIRILMKLRLKSVQAGTTATDIIVQLLRDELK